MGNQTDRNMKAWTEKSRKGYRRAIELHAEKGIVYSPGKGASIYAILFVCVGVIPLTIVGIVLLICNMLGMFP